MSSVALFIANDPGEGFAGPKHLMKIRGTPMIEQVVADAAAWPVDEVVVVLGPEAEEIVRGADLGEATVVIDPEWREGIAASLRVGIDLLERGPAVDRVVIGFADQPGVEGATVEALLDASPSHDAVVPKYRYRRGWPVVVSPGLFDLLLGLEGDPDLHDVLDAHGGDVEEVWFDGLEPSRVMVPTDLPRKKGGGADARVRGDG